MKVVHLNFPSGKRKAFCLNCENCHKEILRYGKADLDKRNKLCSNCFSKVVHKKPPQHKITSICRLCEQRLSIENFTKRPSGHYRTECSKCNNLKKFGLNFLQYKNMCVAQNYKYLICEQKTKLVVDHCHNTGLVRGLLCSNCNTAIGQLKDNTKYLLNAIIYLDKVNNK